LNALREQKSHAKLKDDIVRLKNIEAEIQSIHDNPNVEHKKVKLSTEEKKRKMPEKEYLDLQKRTMFMMIMLR
jgi:hypothetical protein